MTNDAIVIFVISTCHYSLMPAYPLSYGRTPSPLPSISSIDYPPPLFVIFLHLRSFFTNLCPMTVSNPLGVCAVSGFTPTPMINLNLNCLPVFFLAISPRKVASGVLILLPTNCIRLVIFSLRNMSFLTPY